MIKGIDISEWQSGVNYGKAAADGVKFAILRSSYRLTTDKRFFEHVKGFKSAGVDIPAIYHFSYALTAEEAKKEADYCIKQLEAAELPKDTIVFYDFEYDTVTNAKKKGVKLGKKECIAFTNAFCERVQELGYTAGVYANLDYTANMYDVETLNKYVYWLAHYTSGEAGKKCVYHQYTSSGRVNGISGNIDLDYFYNENKGTNKRGEAMTETELRAKAIAALKACHGARQGSKAHKNIIDTFNKSGLCTRYKMTYTAAWCATAVSYTFVSAGLAGKSGSGSLFECVECGCPKMIDLAKKQGIWKESDSYKAKIGDVVLYDWDDDGKGDNTGTPDHVGIVIEAHDTYCIVEEGNKSKAVGTRKLEYNGRYIRGFIAPDYAKFSTADGKTETNNKTNTGNSITSPKKDATSPNKTTMYKCKVTAKAGLNVRKQPSTAAAVCSFSPLAYNTTIDVCDVVEKGTKAEVNGKSVTTDRKWLYIKHNGKYGYVAAEYTKKV